MARFASACGGSSALTDDAWIDEAYALEIGAREPTALSLAKLLGAERRLDAGSGQILRIDAS
ncbi:MAG: hypothetical protein ACXVEF_34150 [Polyangiales bacterium]